MPRAVRNVRADNIRPCEPAPEPPTQAAERGRTPITAIEPIPARADVELSPTARKGPPAGKRAITPTQEQSAAAAEFEDHDAAAGIVPGEALPSRIVHRINPERLPNFTPKHDADLSAETAGNWGGEAAQENSPVFRRTLTAAIITLLVGGICVAGFLLKETFAPRDHNAETPADAVNPVQSVDEAKQTLQAFFGAESIDAMTKHVRHPEITLPRMKHGTRPPAFPATPSSSRSTGSRRTTFSAKA